MNPVELNCVVLWLVSVIPASRLPAGSRVSAVGSIASSTASVWKRFDRIRLGDLPSAAVGHAHQDTPACCGPCPDLRRIRVPDLIRLRCFHAPPLFPQPRSRRTGAHCQILFVHYPQRPLVNHRKTFLPSPPCRHATIFIGRLPPADHDDLLVVLPVRPTASRLLRSTHSTGWSPASLSTASLHIPDVTISRAWELTACDLSFSAGTPWSAAPVQIYPKGQ